MKRFLRKVGFFTYWICIGLAWLFSTLSIGMAVRSNGSVEAFAITLFLFACMVMVGVELGLMVWVRWRLLKDRA
jgi:hypothetical protein